MRFAYYIEQCCQAQAADGSDGRLRIGYERWTLSRVSPGLAAGFLCLSRRRGLPRRRAACRTRRPGCRSSRYVLDACRGAAGRL